MLDNRPKPNEMKRHFYDYQLDGQQDAAIFAGAG